MTEWMAENSLDILNRGRESTFVGARGSSIIDLTLVTTQARRLVRDWRVASDMESLSDHMYIVIDLLTGGEKEETDCQKHLQEVVYQKDRPRGIQGDDHQCCLARGGGTDPA